MVLEAQMKILPDPGQSGRLEYRPSTERFQVWFLVPVHAYTAGSIHSLRVCRKKPIDASFL